MGCDDNCDYMKIYCPISKSNGYQCKISSPHWDNATISHLQIYALSLNETQIDFKHIQNSTLFLYHNSHCIDSFCTINNDGISCSDITCANSIPSSTDAQSTTS